MINLPGFSITVKRIGSAPTYLITFTDAMNVKFETRTKSFFFTPIPIKAK